MKLWLLNSCLRLGFQLCAALPLVLKALVTSPLSARQAGDREAQQGLGCRCGDGQGWTCILQPFEVEESSGHPCPGLTMPQDIG